MLLLGRQRRPDIVVEAGDLRQRRPYVVVSTGRVWGDAGRVTSVLKGQCTHDCRGAVMAVLVRKSLDTPDETRPFEAGMGQVDLVNVTEHPVGRAVFQPGWRWSKHVKPIVQTETCETLHTGYFISGHMKVKMNDGQEIEFGPGDFAVIPPGHDAWIVGNEPCVLVDWQGFEDYAKR
jgi:quercetin dioxygenase-like cupin family protein